jgi:hypothetical protein
MANQKPNFATDLGAIQSTVDLDVGAILSLTRKQQPITSSPEENKMIELEIAEKSKTESTKHRQPNAAFANKRTNYRKQASSEMQNAEPEILENVTTRLTRGTNALLTEAALRQKLAKQKPDTRQDIIEMALSEWFARAGLGRS